MSYQIGPIEAWHREDTIPTSAEGGYAGAASTKAALDQVAAISSTLTPSSTVGLVDYATALSLTTPVVVVEDGFVGDGPLDGRTPEKGPGAWVANAAWTTSGGFAVKSGSSTAGFGGDCGVGDGVIANYDIKVVTSASGAAQTWRCFAVAAAPSSDGSLVNGIWGSVAIGGSTGAVIVRLYKTVSGSSTEIGSAISGAGITANSTATQDVRVTISVQDGWATLSLSTTTATITGPVTGADLSGTHVGVVAYGATPGLSLDAITATRPRTPADKQPEGALVTSTPDGSLPTVVLNALDARYGGASPSAVEPLATLRSFGSGDVTVAVVSDSTANDSFDWLRRWVLMYGDGAPDTVRRTYRAWDRDGAQWGPEIVDNEGGVPPQPSLDDTFTRSGALDASTADTGQVWTAGASWTTDGALASTTVVGDVASIDRPTGSPVTFTIVGDGADRASTAQMRLYAGSYLNGLWVNLHKHTGPGAILQLYKSIGGSSTQLQGTTTLAGFTGDAGQVVTITITQDIQNVTVTAVCNGETTTLSGTITESDSSAIGPQVAMVAGTSVGAWQVDRVQAEAPPVEAPPTFEVWNGAIAGGDLSDFDATLRASMFGGLDVDVLILSMGHNQKSQSPAGFVSEVDGFLAAWRAEHPDGAVLISSQNPQVSPAVGVAAHRDRQAALRKYAKDGGLDYAPVFEAFTAQPDGGASLIDSGGVHPTVGTDSGASLWADTVLSTITAT